MAAPVFAGVWNGFQNMNNEDDGESCWSGGQSCPPLQKLQGQQRKARGSGRGAFGGPGFANVPPDLQLEFKWFFNEVLATAPSSGGTSPAVLHWKSVIIRAIGNMLHALMVFGVSYNVVTHASQHNPDGSHKTIQAEGTTRREDGGKKSKIVKTVPDRDIPDGGFPDRQCEPQLPLGGDYPAANKIVHTIGRLEYRAGFMEVWVDDVLYNLRGRIMARWCLEYLVSMRAFDPASARHFEDEIDPYVRQKSGAGRRGKFSDVQIKQYFNDRKACLSKLRAQLIRSVEGTGKYYLQTGAV
jgi:hypothetical protein